MSAFPGSTAEGRGLLRMCLMEGQDYSLPTFSDVPELFCTLHSIEISVLSGNIPQPDCNFLRLENMHVISPNSKVQADQEEFPPPPPT